MEVVVAQDAVRHAVLVRCAVEMDMDLESLLPPELWLLYRICHRVQVAHL